MISARTTSPSLSACESLRNLPRIRFPSITTASYYCCYSTISLFPSFRVLHSVFFAIKTCHSPVIPSTPTRMQLPSLCSLPASRRRDLTSDATFSPDFVQAPACLFHYCSLFLIIVLCWFWFWFSDIIPPCESCVLLFSFVSGFLSCSLYVSDGSSSLHLVCRYLTGPILYRETA